MDPKRIPLVIGVTGHRDLRAEDLATLRATVRKILQDLQRDYPSTPLLLLSALAEGADRLVADEAIELKVPVLVPLPMTGPEYEKDFARTPGSVEEFRRLLKRAEASIVMPLAHGVKEADLSHPDARGEQYAMSGKFIVRHSHLLLALWDDGRTEKTGGTSQMVRYRLSGFPKVDLPEWASLYPADSGAVCHIVTPRASNPAPPGALTVRSYYTNAIFSRRPEDEEAEGQAGEIFTSILRRTDAFNFDQIRSWRFEPEFEKSAAQLRPPAPEGEPAPRADAVQARYGAADILATYFRNHRRLALKFLSILIVPASLFLDQYDNPALHSVRRYCLAAFVVTMLVSWLLYERTRRNRFDARHLDYRALAEGLKILYFWRMTGLTDDVGAQYLRKQRSELDWIRFAIRASDLPTCFAPPPPHVFSWIETAWIEDQRDYFNRSALRADRTVAKKRRFIFVMTVISILLTLAMLAQWPIPRNALYDTSGVLIVFLGTIGAVLAYTEKLGLSYQSKQYRQMCRLFTCAGREYHAALAANQPQHLHAILRRLGQEALRENGDWLLLHRERPTEMHVG
jgi:hypothetical protein